MSAMQRRNLTYACQRCVWNYATVEVHAGLRIISV